MNISPEIKDVLTRAGKTFIQASLAILIGSGIVQGVIDDGALPSLDAAQKVAYSVGFGGLAAALSAIQNGLKTLWNS